MKDLYIGHSRINKCLYSEATDKVSSLLCSIIVGSLGGNSANYI